MTTYSEQGCPFKDGGCSYLDHNHPMTTSTIKEKMAKILTGVLGDMVDENIMPHDKYEDAVEDEDIVICGQQLMDTALDAILQLFDEAKVQGFMTAKGYRFKKNQWWIDRPNNGFGVMTQAMAEEWHDRTTKDDKQGGSEK